MVQPSHSIEIRKSSTPKTGPQRGPLDCPGCSKSVGRRVAARVVSQESTTRRGASGQAAENSSEIQPTIQVNDNELIQVEIYRKHHGFQHQL